MLAHSEQTATIYSLAATSGQVYMKAVTFQNWGFEKTGSSPFIEEIFTKQDFIFRSITDSPAIQVAAQTKSDLFTTLATSAESAANSPLLPPLPKPSPKKQITKRAHTKSHSVICFLGVL